MNNTINDYQLLELLDVKNILTNTNFSINEIFEAIAKKIINEYHIQKNGIYYDLLEIELYYFDKNHLDIITYPRTTEKGLWFFHSSGVDVSFKSICKDNFKKTSDADDNFFGGILIRSLLKNKNTVIAGPLKCTWELFDAFDAFSFSPKELPVITKKESDSKFNIYKTERRIPYNEDNLEANYGKNYNNFKEFLPAKYCYFVEQAEWKNFSASKYVARPWDRTKESNY